MGLFVCDSCGCVENTALGNYWTKDMEMFADPELNGKALCSECGPAMFKDGAENEDGGKWHGRWPKTLWDGKKEVLNRKPGDPAIPHKGGDV